MSSAKWNSCCLFGSGSDTFKVDWFLVLCLFVSLIIPGFFFFLIYKDVNYMLEFIILTLSHSMLEIFTFLTKKGSPDPKLSSR